MEKAFKLDGLALVAAPDVRIKNQQATIAALKKDIEKLNKALLDKEEFYSAVAGAVHGAQPFPTPRKSRATEKSEAVACLMLSDWHIGEIVSAAETGGMNEYNYEIAQERLFRIVENFLRWVDMHRVSYKIDECCVITAGDMVTGNIHQELLETNEFPLPIAVANAGEMLGEVYQRLQPEFNQLRALQVSGGNHDRLSIKPKYKHRAEDSYGELIHRIANATMKRTPNFVAETTVAFAHEFRIAGKLFHVTHGDVVQGQMGIPYYGFWRYVARVARKRMEMNAEKISTFLFGHWHQFAALDDGSVILNRSLIGPTEYDLGAQRYAKSGQVAFLVSPNHGTFNITAFDGE